MTDDDITHAINLYRADWIVLTGGEPSLQIDNDFIRLLHKTTGKRIAIETNGTVSLPENIDWITLSPKTGISGDNNLPVVIDHADEIKVVDVGQNLEPYFSLPCRSNDTFMYLQPCFVKQESEYRENIFSTIGRVLSDPRWTLSVQMHRFLDIP